MYFQNAPTQNLHSVSHPKPNCFPQCHSVFALKKYTHCKLENRIPLCNEKAFKTSRLMYILQAAFEFLISNMVTGSFLAIITNELGFTDGMTGILSTIGSLGCVIQLFSMSIRTKRVKPLVITLSLLTQVLFLTMYLIPLSRGSQPVRQAAFFAVVLLAYVFFYLIHPKKISWLMSIVDQNKRGRFTAVKENASLLSGMFFCYILRPRRASHRIYYLRLRHARPHSSAHPFSALCH